ncbi:hypothetical protein FG93_02607 [Bosea sp. LC85]|uniref:DUF1579 domain-containing protein n=1 Tax=Bosea sp. LC85 TaxID=1502851 RepID=UPI0004E3300B|nr:DUF1579 domain-containing protein [Bosea sp. LC85]KFC70850.1 hypothetical protein FG93_02607 [Bosea sp. LC85]
MQTVEPQDEHRWLQQLLGNWTYESNCSPDKPDEVFKGSETFRSIGDLWVVGESTSEMPGGGASTMQITLGFDPQKGRFVGTWLGSMMAMIWTYEGFLDDSRKILTLESEGPSFSGDGTTAKYRDIVELRSPTERLFYSKVLGADGSWTEFMKARYQKI